MYRLSEKELLVQFKNEETRSLAFSRVVDEYQQRLYLHIRRLVIDHNDADDVLQNTFIKVWKALESFKGDSLLYTWLYRIATNEAITFLDQKRKRFFIPIVNVEQQLSKSLEDDSFFTGDQIQLKLQKAILTLPEKQRIVFNMKYYEEMKYEEMSEILRTSVGALKASYHHAVKKIEVFLKEN